MKDKIERDLLTQLLDKYERSNFYRKGTIPTRRILLKLYDNGQCDFPQYDIEQSDQRLRINAAVATLAAKGLVSYEWMKGEENHIISKVWLNYDQLDAVYKYVGRRAKSEIIDEICVEILETLEKVNAEWAKKFLQEAYHFISEKQSLGSQIPEDKKERDDLFQAIRFLETIGEHELLERVFSIQCFGDSKKFEHTVKPKLVSILRKNLDNEEDAKEEELLRQIGIVKYPEQFEFCGDVSLVFQNGAQVDFVPLKSGSCICLPDLLRGRFILNPSIKTIISIENKANYVDYLSKNMHGDELVIFHGGQYSPSKRRFLLAVAEAAADRRWFHWGDIDYGGFSMLARLRRGISPSILPYRMNKEELLRYENLTVSFAPSYGEKLKHFLEDPIMKDCWNCIEFMLEQRIKLEQEALLMQSISLGKKI